MQINLLGGSYEQKYIAANSQRTINWYPVTTTQTEQNKSQIALYPTPGLKVYTTLPGRYFRGIFTARTHQGTRCFAVVDNILYEILTNATYSTIGTMTDMSIGSSKVYMECNLQNELFIGHYSASYVFNMTSSALTKVTDTFFPGSINFATYLDQYMIVCSAGAVFESLTTSALNWSASQTYSPTFKSAPVVAVGAFKEQIYNFTTETIEVFLNDGSSPYSRLPRSTQLVGIAAKDSLVTFDAGFFFLGKKRNGEAGVYFYDGYQSPQKISDSSVTWQLNRGTPITDAYAYIQYTKDGHIWYYLTIPSINYTFVYDFTTNMWHWRQSLNPSKAADGSSQYTHFRGNCMTSFNDQNLFGDEYSGKVFIEDYSTFTEDSNVIRRERTSQIESQELKNISVDRLIIDCNNAVGLLSGQGSSPVLQVSWSTDAGYTFTQPYNMTLGQQGQYSYRARVNKLGTGRNWVIKIVLTDPVDLMVQSAVVNGTVDQF